MKRKYTLLWGILLSLLFTFAFVLYHSKTAKEQLNLMKMNIEALTQTEVIIVGDPCAWNPYSFCDYFYMLNGVLIKDHMEDYVKPK